MRPSTWLLLGLVLAGLSLSALAGASTAEQRASTGGMSTEAAPRAGLGGASFHVPAEAFVWEVPREEGNRLVVQARWDRPADAFLVPATSADVLAALRGEAPPSALHVARNVTSLDVDVAAPPDPDASTRHGALRALLYVAAQDAPLDPEGEARPPLPAEAVRGAFDRGFRTVNAAVLVLRFDAPVAQEGTFLLPIALRYEAYDSAGREAAVALRWTAALLAALALAPLAAWWRTRGDAGGRAEEASPLEGAMRHVESLDAFLRQVAWVSRLYGAAVVLLAVLAMQAFALLHARAAAGRVSAATAAGLLVFVAWGGACLALGWTRHVRRVRRETGAWRARLAQVRRDQSRFLAEE